MRVAILGAGGMGTILGAYIAEQGLPIHLISRNKAHVQALKERGATVIGQVQKCVPVCAFTPQEVQGEYDLVFLMTKQRGNEQTLKNFLPHLKKDGIVCTTQNGLPEYSVASVVGEERTAGAALSWGATFHGEGISELTSSPQKLQFVVGSIFEQKADLSLIERYFACMGKVTIEENFLGARWAKLSINSTFSSLSALTGLTFGEIAKDKLGKRLSQQLLKECFLVAKGNQITVGKVQGHNIQKLLDYHTPIGKWCKRQLLPLAMKNHSQIRSGMYYDLISGKGCDIDDLCGVVQRFGKRCGVPTPMHDRVVDLIHEIEKGRKIDKNNLILLR